MARNGNRNNGNGGGNGGTGAGGNGGGNHGGGGNGGTNAGGNHGGGNVSQARSAGGGGGNGNSNRGGGGNGNGGVSAGQNNGNHHNNGNGGVSAGHATGHNGNRNNGGGGGAAGNGGTSAPVPVSSWTNDYEQWQREHPNPGHSPGTPDNANYAAWLKQHPHPGNSQGGNRNGSGGAAAPAGNGNDEGTLVISHNSVAPSGAADPVPAIDDAQPIPMAPAQPVQSTGGIAAPGSATPQPATYTVQPGDTLSDIAEEAGISLARLKALNPQIRNANLIFPGQAIRVEANGPAPNAGAGGISVPAQGNGPGGIAAPADAGFPTSSTYPPTDSSVQKAAARLKKYGAKQGWGDGNGGVTADPAQRAMTVASAPDTNPLKVKDAKNGRKGFRVVSAPK